MLTKNDISALLDEKNIAYEIINHRPIFTIEEADELHIDKMEYVPKNLFLCDDKKQHFYLAVVSPHKRVNLNELRDKLSSRRLKFANEEMLQNMLGVKPGSVTPLGIFNDEQKRVCVIFDNALKSTTVGVHPLSNDSTVFLSFDDLISLIESHQNEISMLDF